MSHEYFLDNMQYGDLIISLRYLQFAEVAQWQQTRELMLCVMRPYLKRQDTTVQDLFILPTDEIHVPNHSISNNEVSWYKNYVKNYKKEHQA